MKRLFFMMGTTAGLLGLVGGSAQATPTTTTPPQWSYSYNVAPSSQVLATAGNNGSLAITGAQNVAASGNSVVTLASLTLSSTAQTVDSAVLASNNWSGVLTIHDAATGGSASLTLSGAFMGANLTAASNPGTFSANNANVYFNPAALKIATGSTTTGSWSTIAGSNGQIADYVWTAGTGGNTYTIPVADLSFTPPGIPQSTTGVGSSQQLNGAIAATIDVGNGTGGGTTGGGGGTTGGGGGTTAGTPEPSTLLLSCFGVGFAGLASIRRRRTLAARLA